MQPGAEAPSEAPTEAPTQAPTEAPTEGPTEALPGSTAATPLSLSISYFRKLKQSLLENRATQGPAEGIPGIGLLRRTRKSAPGGPRTPRGSADPQKKSGTT